MRLSEAPSLPSLQGCWSTSPGGHFWLRPTLVLSEGGPRGPKCATDLSPVLVSVVCDTSPPQALGKPPPVQ